MRRKISSNYIMWYELMTAHTIPSSMLGGRIFMANGLFCRSVQIIHDLNMFKMHQTFIDGCYVEL